jgi:dTDP-4-dehydrorhamnose 3,5-epimerase
VTQGAVFDVVVDIRNGSPTFGKWFGLELSEQNKKQLWIPAGLAHGFLVTSESAEFLYKTTDYYHPESEKSILWNDPAIGIEWPLHLLVGCDPLLAAKDANALGLQGR